MALITRYTHDTASRGPQRRLSQQVLALLEVLDHVRRRDGRAELAQLLGTPLKGLQHEVPPARALIQLLLLQHWRPHT